MENDESKKHKARIAHERFGRARVCVDAHRQYVCMVHHSVTSAGNKIVAGTLKIDLELLDKTGNWTSLKESEAPIFNYDNWEPGYTDVKILKVENEGSLALKWYAKFVSDFELSELANVIDVYVKPSTTAFGYAADRTDLSTWTLAGTVAEFVNTISTTTYGSLTPQGETGSVAYLGIALKMQEDAGNKYQGMSIGGAFDIQILATQYTYEEDSFDNLYDEKADFDGEISTISALNAALANGGTYKVLADLALDETATVPNGVAVTLDLNGKTITGGYQTDSTTKHIYAIENKGTLTLKNGTVNARGIANYGTLTVEDGVYNAVDNNGGAAIWNYAGSNVTVNGGTFTAAQATAAPAATVMHVADGATAVVNGGTFKTDADWTYAIISYGDLTIKDANVSGEHGAIAAEAGNLTINGGTYEITASGHLIYSTAATITLNGGSFKHSQIGAAAGGNVILYATASAQAAVNGGSYDSVEGAFAYSGMTGNIAITGGTFANKAATVYGSTDGVAAFVKDGYIAYDNGNGTYTVMKGAKAATQTDLNDAVKEGGTIVLSAGTYTFPANNIAAGSTLVCAPGTVFDGKTGLNINGATVVGATFTNDNDYLVYSTTVNGTFKDCTFTDCKGLRYCYAGDTVVFENCTFDTDFYGVHFDGGANEVIFKNCDFTGFNTFGGAITKLTLEGCTFKYNGKGGYNGINLWGDTEMTGCTFVFDGSASYEWVDLRDDGITATFTDCVVTDGTNETPLKNVVGNYGDGNTIIIDGVTVNIPNMT